MDKEQIIKSLSSLQNSIVDDEFYKTLMKAQVLASRINSELLLNWCQNELNGYSHSDALPSYRILDGAIQLNCVANHLGHTVSRTATFQRNQLSQDVADQMGQEMIEDIFQMRLTQPIAEIMSMIDQVKKTKQHYVVSLPISIGEVFLKPTGIVYDRNYYVASQNHQLESVIPKAQSSLLGAILSIQNEFGKPSEFAHLDEIAVNSITRQIIQQHIYQGGKVTMGNNYNQKANIIQGNQGDKGKVEIHNNAPLQNAQKNEVHAYINEIKTLFGTLQRSLSNEEVLANQELLIGVIRKITQLEETLTNSILEGNVDRQDLVQMLEPVWEEHMKVLIADPTKKFLKKHAPSLLMKLGLKAAL